MNVLLIGSGGREHALAWKLSASPLLTKLYAAPGNPGIAAEAELVPLSPDDHAAIVAFCRERAIDLVVVGPEAPLVAGLGDRLHEAGIRVFGGSAAAASGILQAAGVDPTARGEQLSIDDFVSIARASAHDTGEGR